jgi:hypothetical protein
VSGPERIGIGIPSGEAAGGRQWHCPGALLRVTRDDFLLLRREGQVWSTGERDIAQDGLSYARAFCREDCAQIVTLSGAVYHAGLCKACSELERNNRADLASRRAGR